MKTEYNSKLIYVIAVVAATGGLLFGFDTGVISGAIPFFQKDFGIDNGMIEIITASGLCGAILGALFCGKVTDTLGRRKVILASAVFFAIGALWSGFAPDVYHLIASRLFLGVAVGVSSFASYPLSRSAFKISFLCSCPNASSVIRSSTAALRLMLTN